MAGYIGRLVLLTIPVVVAVTIIVFAMVAAIPGDVAQRLAGSDATAEDIASIRHQLGLDRPLVIQYGVFLWKALHGDLGRSLVKGAPVVELVVTHAWATVQLALSSLAIAVVVGVVLGVISALKHNTIWDNLATVTAIAGISMPIFWLGLLLMWLFAVTLGWLPTSGRGSLLHLVLPSLTLAAAATATITRMTRSSMLEVLRQDYIRTAHAKGLRYLTVVARHALPNAMIPVITVVGLQLGYLLAGSVLTETVFAWPGIGRLAVEAIKDGDIPLVQGAILVMAVGFVFANLLVDVLYAYVDPRIRYD